MQQDVFNGILKAAIKKNVSDIHFQVGHPPIFRLHGELVKAQYHELQPQDTRAIVDYLLEQGKIDRKQHTLTELDLSHAISGVGRFRASIFRQQGVFSIVVRAMSDEVTDLKELNLPIAVQEISEFRRGLVLVTGSSGMGKSTTLAAMVDHINEDRAAHIVTLEDPIEFLHTPKMAVISQREVGHDTTDFVAGLRAVLRQDIDVILVSDVRDAGTLDMALRAAEAGNLVLGAFHTADVITTIERLICLYPDYRQHDIRSRLADNLMAIIALRLLLNKEGTLRVPVVEIMKNHPDIQECLLDPKRTTEIPTIMAESREIGMQTFDQHLFELHQVGGISRAVAVKHASNPTFLEQPVE